MYLITNAFNTGPIIKLFPQYHKNDFLTSQIFVLYIFSLGNLYL